MIGDETLKIKSNKNRTIQRETQTIFFFAAKQFRACQNYQLHQTTWSAYLLKGARPSGGTSSCNNFKGIHKMRSKLNKLRWEYQWNKLVIQENWKLLILIIKAKMNISIGKLIMIVVKKTMKANTKCCIFRRRSIYTRSITWTKEHKVLSRDIYDKYIGK